MTMTKTPYEHNVLHPRIAHWIDEQKLLYIHEYRVTAGQIDFLTISPRSGCISIIEGKMNIDRPEGPIAQVNYYERFLGVADICKMVFSYNPVLDWQSNMFEMAGFEIYITGEDAPVSRIKKMSENIDAFWEVFEYFYDKPLDVIFRGAPTRRTPIERTFTVFDVSDMVKADPSLSAAFSDGWGLLDMPYGDAE